MKPTLWESIPKALAILWPEYSNLGGRLGDWQTKSTEKKVAAAENVSKLTPQSKPSSVGADQRQQFLWDAQKVDEDSFKKDGIAYAIG